MCTNSHTGSDCQRTIFFYIYFYYSIYIHKFRNCVKLLTSDKNPPILLQLPQNFLIIFKYATLLLC